MVIAWGIGRNIDYLGISIDKPTGPADADGGLSFISSENEEGHASEAHICDSLNHVILQFIFDGCGSHQL